MFLAPFALVRVWLLTPCRDVDLEKEASQAAEASIAAQAALDAEVREHEALRSAVRTACEALDVEEV